jgi:hypothetical protein
MQKNAFRENGGEERRNFVIVFLYAPHEFHAGSKIGLFFLVIIPKNVTRSYK